MSTRSARYNTLAQHTPKGRMLSGSDRDAAAFLEAAGIVVTHQQRAIYELVRLLKQYGLWSKMKAIYPFVGGTATTHKWNLKDPRDLDAAFRLTFSGGWTHSANGATPNGSTGYANTYLNPSTTLTLFNAHLSYYSRTTSLGNSNNIDIGNYISSNDKLFCLILPRSSGFAAAVHTDQTNANYYASKSTYTSSSGFWLNNRSSSASADLQLWRNGVNEAQASQTNLSGSFATYNIYIGALSTASGALFWGLSECAFSSIGDGLTTAQSAALYNIVDLYQKRLGRAV